LLAKLTSRNLNHGNDRFSMFNKERDILGLVASLKAIHTALKQMTVTNIRTSQTMKRRPSSTGGTGRF
jgi:hypothetical protein